MKLKRFRSFVVLNTSVSNGKASERRARRLRSTFRLYLMPVELFITCALCRHGNRCVMLLWSMCIAAIEEIPSVCMCIYDDGDGLFLHSYTVDAYWDLIWCEKTSWLRFSTAQRWDVCLWHSGANMRTWNKAFSHSIYDMSRITVCLMLEQVFPYLNKVPLPRNGKRKYGSLQVGFREQLSHAVRTAQPSRWAICFHCCCQLLDEHQSWSTVWLLLNAKTHEVDLSP